MSGLTPAERAHVKQRLSHWTENSDRFEGLRLAGVRSQYLAARRLLAALLGAPA